MFIQTSGDFLSLVAHRFRHVDMSNFRIFVFIFVAGLAYGKNNKDSKSDTSKSKAIKEIRQDIQIRLSSKLFPSKLKGVVERSSYVIFARWPKLPNFVRKYATFFLL